MFPKEEDPKGEPETWTDEQMKRWLNNVSQVMRGCHYSRLIWSLAKSDGRELCHKGGVARESQGEHAGA